MTDTLADDLTVPGTVVILDQAAGDDLPSTNFTLVPTPSADPNDPLNWSKGRKWLSLLCLNLWILAVFTVVGCLYPIYGPLSDTTGLSLDNINAGVGYLYFAAAVFALFTLPLQVAIGYRPVFIATCLGVCIFPFALSQVKNNGQYIGLCVLNALFVSPVFVSPETVLCNVVSFPPLDPAHSSSSTTSGRSPLASMSLCCTAASCSLRQYPATSTPGSA